MFQRKPRRFRRRPNGRDQLLQGNGYMHTTRSASHVYSNNQTRNNFRTTQSAEKLFEKYNDLAKEAISFGDKTLSENYFQHADHFMRIIEDKNKNRNKNKTNVVEKSNEDIKKFSKDTDIKQEDSTENKE